MNKFNHLVILYFLFSIPVFSNNILYNDSFSIEIPYTNTQDSVPNLHYKINYLEKECKEHITTIRKLTGEKEQLKNQNLLLNQEIKEHSKIISLSIAFIFPIAAAIITVIKFKLLC